MRIYFSLEIEDEKCCNEIDLNWNPGMMIMTEITPVGKYTQQTFQSHEKVVYYNNENHYFIYNRGNDWVVRILTTLISAYYLNSIFIQIAHCLGTEKRNICYHFQVGSTLQAPTVLFVNTNCFNTTCPENCGKHWQVNFNNQDTSTSVTNSSITLKCAG